MLAVSRLFGDGAVLQRDQLITIWGRSSPSASLSVTVAGDSATARADDQGSWSMQLPPRHAGGPYTMTISSQSDSSRETLEVSDLWFGDVWLLAGQSNMELWMGRVADRYGDSPSGSNDGGVRFFTVPQKTDFHGPQVRLMDGEWTVAGRDDLTNVSGVGFFFARALRERHPDVPLALLQTAIGGTPIESWMDQCDLNRLGLSSDHFASLGNDEFLEVLTAEDERAAAAYQDDVRRLDRGLTEHWEAPDYDDSQWKEIGLDQAGPQQHEISGPAVVWFRKTIEVPEKYVGRSGRLAFGTLIDADDCFVNGSLIGSTGYRYPPRNYDIPKVPHRMTIAVRLRVDSSSGGGFTPGKAHELLIDDAAGTTTRIDLDDAGKWKYSKSTDLPEAPQQHFLAYEQSGCFNAMISPLSGTGLTGVLWYQGESNATRTPQRYADKLMTLIQSWRALFHSPELPFLFVQLPNIGFEAQGWARLRDEQRKALVMDRTAMIVSLDAGEDNDLHPLDKQTVGKRLAYAADSLAYGADHTAMGPLIAATITRPGNLILTFTCAGTGLCASSDIAFELSDTGNWADAKTVFGKISSHDTVTIALECDTVFGPDARIRYAWGQSPKPILKNEEGLLASPFEVLVH